MVSIHKVPVIVLLNISVICFIFRFKRGANSCCPFHDVKALALPCLSKRATSKAPRRCMIIQPTCASNFKKLNTIGAPIIHPRGIHRCFVFDRQFGICEILTSSKPKRSVNAFLCICLPPIHSS